MWTVQTAEGGEVALVQADAELLAQVAGAGAQRGPNGRGSRGGAAAGGTGGFSGPLDLVTKTEAAQERDDAALELDALIGLTTKTHAQQERDDQAGA